MNRQQEAWQGENFGYALKALALALEPDRPALIHGERVIGWREFDQITDSIAASLLERGLAAGDVVGQMQRNSPEYLLAFFGMAKAQITPVNVNYRYTRRECVDIFARFGLKGLFVDREFLEEARTAMPQGALAPIVAEPGEGDWEALCHNPAASGFAPERGGEAVFFMATGGTTGMPKAVMWPAREFWAAQSISNFSPSPLVEPYVASTFEDHVAKAADITPDHPASSSPLVLLCPLMHGTAQYTAIGHLLRGGTVVTLPGARFDPDLAIDTIAARAARSMVLVGDAHAIPLVERLEARADGAEAFASLRLLGSSGALFSQSVKERLIAINPDLVIADVLGSSESGGGTAVRITNRDGTSGGGDFVPAPGREIVLLDENLRFIEPGSDAVGIVARSGPLPLGYFGEDEKNAATFPVIDGKRYLITGDRARWGKDGTIEFIGRDNMCINTGGEKVFPEEVESVLAEHPEVEDVRVVGVPDPRFGRKVAAVVRASGDTDDLADRLDRFAREHLADFKVPRAYVFTRESLRLNNGKPDYKRALAIAEAAIQRARA